MELECSSNNGLVLVDYKDALMRWSKSWAELAEGNVMGDVETLKVEDLESDAGYASEGSYRRFYLGSKSASICSHEECNLDEETEDFGRSSDDVYDIPDDSDVEDAGCDATGDVEGDGLDVSIEMIGSECVLVNGFLADDLPCPTEATRDGMTPEVILEYDHEDLVEVACRYLAYCAGRNEQNIRPKICWAMKYAPDYEDDSEADSES